MKNLSVLFALSLLGFAARAALPQPDLIAQLHFAGAQKISANPNAVAFTNEFCSAPALALRSQTADKLSGWLAGWLQTNLGVTVPGGAAKLRPLFDDLQKSEWFFEARTAANGKATAAIVIKLDPARMPLWQAGLKAFFPAADFKTKDGWLLFDSNPALLKLGDRLAQRIVLPAGGWMDVDINWPRLALWYPKLKELVVPETILSLTVPDTNFRLLGKFLFPEKLALTLDPWRVPTNTIQQPLNNFTAVRGFAGWLQAQPWAQVCQITPALNQFFVWSQPSYPFQTFAAAPVPDAQKALEQMQARVTNALSAANAKDYFLASLTPDVKDGNINFIGMPVIAPYLRAVTEPAGQFLFWETFPNGAKSKPPQQQLLERLAAKNLVYYHWEITAERMPQLLQMSQFSLMLTKHKQLDDSTAAFKWLQQIGPTLGNTATEIAQTGPAEFTFTRVAPGLFTAPELYVLANWLEATNFPGCDLKLPPPPPRPIKPHPAAPKPATPAPAAH